MVCEKVLRGTSPHERQNSLANLPLSVPEKVSCKLGVCVQLEFGGRQLCLKDIGISTVDLGVSWMPGIGGAVFTN